MINRLSLIQFLAGLSFILAISCSEKEKAMKVYPHINSEDEVDDVKKLLSENGHNLDLNLSLWNYFSKNGDYDSVIKYANPVFLDSESGSDLHIYSAATIAQAYLLNKKFDSVPRYIATLDSSKLVDNHPLNLVINNIIALYSLQAEMNYPKALMHFRKAYDYALERNDKYNQCIFLCNMSYIYYLRRDTSGIKFTEKACEIASSLNDDFVTALTSLNLANMYHSSGRNISALALLEKARVLSEKNGYYSIIPEIYVTNGDIYDKLGNEITAESYYRKAISSEYGKNNTLANLKYATFLYDRRRLDEAEKYYRKGLGILEATSDAEYKYLYLKGLSNVFRQTGQTDSALHYFTLYHYEFDRIFNTQKESEFNQLLMEYQKLTYENSIKKRESYIIAASSVSIVILIICAALYILWQRKNRMYRQLVEQHQEFMQKKENLMEYIQEFSEERNNRNDKGEYALFEKINTLMYKDKIYKNKDISLDMLTEILNSNRTYISKAINKYTGKTFFSYINSYRIEEATRILSGNSEKISLKDLSEELGYSSISVFSRVFQKEIGCSPSKYREQARIINSAKDN